MWYCHNISFAEWSLVCVGSELTLRAVWHAKSQRTHMENICTTIWSISFHVSGPSDVLNVHFSSYATIFVNLIWAVR
jgi:hypothetical protein